VLCISTTLSALLFINDLPMVFGFDFLMFSVMSPVMSFMFFLSQIAALVEQAFLGLFYSVSYFYGYFTLAMRFVQNTFSG